MMKTDLLSPPLRVVHTSMGTMAMMEMEVIHPMPAMMRTRSGTLGEAYRLNLVSSMHTHGQRPDMWEGKLFE